MIAILLSLAQAQPTPKPVHVDFTELDVTAKADGPELHVVTERKALRFESGIKVRADFNAEIASSADEVR